MAHSILSVTVRDPKRPCAPYQSTGHSFFLQVYHCDGTPLFWGGVNFGSPNPAEWVPLQLPGRGGGRIHGQYKVPPGCYLVRAVARCFNVVTEWAYVKVGCDTTVCVELIPPPVWYCIHSTITGILAGTIDDTPLVQIAPAEVEEAVGALRKLTERLPRTPFLPDPPRPEVFEQFREPPTDPETAQ